MKRKIVVNKKIIIQAILILMLVIIGGVTYAYFTAGVEGNEEAKGATANTGTMSLEFDGTSIVGLEGALPGAYHEINFSVKNTGTLTTSYGLELIEVVNNFADPTDLVYSITSTNGGGSIQETIVPQGNAIIMPVAYIQPGVTQEYTMVIHFKETGDNQNDNQGKVFGGVVQLNSELSSNTLGQRLLTDNTVIEQSPNFYQAAPGAYTDYKEQIAKDKNYTTLKYTAGANLKTANGYVLNSSNGKFSISNDGETFDILENSVGKYTCLKRGTASHSCDVLYKIKEVNFAETNYTQKTTEKSSTTATINEDTILGASFEYDLETGMYTLQNTTSNVTLDNTYLEYYFCRTQTDTSCNLMYKIKEISDGTLTKLDEYSFTSNYDYITVADEYTSSSDTKEKSGIYVANDEDGPSYYFRGEEENNYVKLGTHTEAKEVYIVGKNGDPNSKIVYSFNNISDAEKDCKDWYDTDYGYESLEACIANIENASVKAGDPILWRVMRITGDGTIRLISKLDIGSSKYNDAESSDYSVGYTYNNSAPNVQDGTPSIMKTFLDNWYKDNLLGYDAMLAESWFCNDTTMTGGFYSAAARINESSPSFICPETNVNYGGKYRLKIGLISSDELMFAGYGQTGNAEVNKPNNRNYLMEGIEYTSMSPLTTSGGQPNMFYVYWENYLNGTFGQPHKVRPVINLKASTKISGGDGSMQSPFIVY